MAKASAKPTLKITSRVLAGVLALSLSSCDFAPNYKRPTYALPNGWKGQGILEDAKPSAPSLTMEWWKMWHDPVLDKLEKQLLEQNTTLKEAQERVTQARDVAKESESRLFPQMTGAGGMSQNRGSKKRLFYSGYGVNYESNESYSAAATWEPDFWDYIRNQTHMYKNLAQQTAAEYALTRLLLEAELADTYIAIRSLDAQIAVYTDSIKYFKAAVEITRLRQGGSIGAGLDVSRSENQLYSSQGAQQKLIGERQVLEHALAILVNEIPRNFTLKPSKAAEIPMKYVGVKVNIPSELLQRRPDVAMAERRMAAISRSIGVSRAAFFPHITLSASGGFMDGGFDLTNLSNAMWRAAVQFVEPIFTGGQRRAALQRSWSQYRESVDSYRTVVLGAFADVEDGISETHFYRSEQKRLKQAVNAALRAQSMTLALYTGGVSNYLDALVAQQDALSSRLLEVKANARQLQSTVRLVRALGGGWNEKLMPTVKQIDPFNTFNYSATDHPRKLSDVPTNPTDPLKDTSASEHKEKHHHHHSKH